MSRFPGSRLVLVVLLLAVPLLFTSSAEARYAPKKAIYGGLTDHAVNSNEASSGGGPIAINVSPNGRKAAATVFWTGHCTGGGVVGQSTQFSRQKVAKNGRQTEFAIYSSNGTTYGTRLKVKFTRTAAVGTFVGQAIAGKTRCQSPVLHFRAARTFAGTSLPGVTAGPSVANLSADGSQLTSFWSAVLMPCSDGHPDVDPALINSPMAVNPADGSFSGTSTVSGTTARGTPYTETVDVRGNVQGSTIQAGVKMQVTYSPAGGPQATCQTSGTDGFLSLKLRRH